MVDFCIRVDFSIMGEGGQADKKTDKQADKQTHQHHDTAWPKGRAE